MGLYKMEANMLLLCIIALVTFVHCDKYVIKSVFQRRQLASLKFTNKFIQCGDKKCGKKPNKPKKPKKPKKQTNKDMKKYKKKLEEYKEKLEAYKEKLEAYKKKKEKYDDCYKPCEKTFCKTLCKNEKVKSK